MYWNRPWKCIFRGGFSTAIAPENTIFRGEFSNGTVPRNAFSGAVKVHHGRRPIFTIGDIVAVGQTVPENLFYPPQKMFSVAVVVQMGPRWLEGWDSDKWFPAFVSVGSVSVTIPTPWRDLVTQSIVQWKYNMDWKLHFGNHYHEKEKSFLALSFILSLLACHIRLVLSSYLHERNLCDN